MKNKIIIGIFVAIGAVIGFSSYQANHAEVAGTHTVVSSPTTLPKPTKIVVPTVKLAPTNTPTPTTQIQSSASQQTQTTTGTTAGLSNNNYYTNVNGNQVHSPAYSTNGSVPAGATAQCSDGTYSFSQHRSGTCSHHGGVAQWY